jgi:hypothetical protein
MARQRLTAQEAADALGTTADAVGTRTGTSPVTPEPLSPVGHALRYLLPRRCASASHCGTG